LAFVSDYREPTRWLNERLMHMGTLPNVKRPTQATAVAKIGGISI